VTLDDDTDYVTYFGLHGSAKKGCRFYPHGMRRHAQLIFYFTLPQEYIVNRKVGNEIW